VHKFITSGSVEEKIDPDDSREKPALPEDSIGRRREWLGGLDPSNSGIWSP